MNGARKSGAVSVALTGFGSVGQAFAAILRDYPEIPLRLTAVADRGGFAADPGGLDPNELLAAKREGSVASHRQGQGGAFDADVLSASGAGFLVEAASTSYADGEPGWTYVRTALEAGLNVVLASKGPLVVHWDDLFNLAKAKGCRVRYSATHGAPVPAIDLARVALAGSRLNGIRALLNSTTGLILESMEGGASLDQAIQQARSAGVIETDPSLDLEGFDAAAKCVILARSLFDARLGIDDVDRQGIMRLTGDEVRQAHEAGTPMRLLARIAPEGGEVRASVQPARLDRDDPLSSLRKGALGVIFEAEPVGPLFVSGYGKGGKATAAAVIRDILNIAGEKDRIRSR